MYRTRNEERRTGIPVRPSFLNPIRFTIVPGEHPPGAFRAVAVAELRIRMRADIALDLRPDILVVADLLADRADGQDPLQGLHLGQCLRSPSSPPGMSRSHHRARRKVLEEKKKSVLGYLSFSAPSYLCAHLVLLCLFPHESTEDAMVLLFFGVPVVHRTPQRPLWFHALPLRFS